MTTRETISDYLAILHLQAIKCKAMLTLIIQEKSGFALSKLLLVVLIRCGNNSEVTGPEDEIHTIKFGLLFAMSGVLGAEGILWKNGLQMAPIEIILQGGPGEGRISKSLQPLPKQFQIPPLASSES